MEYNEDMFCLFVCIKPFDKLHGLHYQDDSLKTPPPQTGKCVKCEITGVFCNMFFFSLCNSHICFYLAISMMFESLKSNIGWNHQLFVGLSVSVSAVNAELVNN